MPRPRFTSGMDPRTHWIGGWVGLRADMNTEPRGKILCFSQGSNPGRPVCSQLYWLSYSHRRYVLCNIFNQKQMPVLNENWFETEKRLCPLQFHYKYDLLHIEFTNTGFCVHCLPSGWMKTEQMASPYWFRAVQVYSPSSPGPMWLMSRETFPVISSYFILYLLDSKQIMHAQN
jgi:hypothetical protein